MFSSSSLTFANCFAQRFPAVGRFAYRLAREDGSGDTQATYPFTIGVVPAPAGQAPQQRDITVNAGSNGPVADPADVTVNAGDIVVWNTPDPTLSGFAVEVQLPVETMARSRFLALDPSKVAAMRVTGSRTMHNNAFFTHAFGLPGDYRWNDANGGKAAGLIHVRALDVKTDADRKVWLSKLEEGVGITVRGDSVDLTEVNIIIGQTVAWSIVDSPGVRIHIEPVEQVPPSPPVIS